jgi:hypothetical protein
MTGTPIALVTGATAGLGRAVAGALADHDAIALLINNAGIGAGPGPAGPQPLRRARSRRAARAAARRPSGSRPAYDDTASA